MAVERHGLDNEAMREIERANIECDSLDPKKEVPEKEEDVKLLPGRKLQLWKTCPLILTSEMCERLAYYGIQTNFIVYLTDYMGYNNADATSQANNWSGTCYMTPLLGAFFADAYLGRFWTIIVFSAIYIVGLSCLAVSAGVSSIAPVLNGTPSGGQLFFYWFSMYLIAVGTGGIKPNVSSFGADQFLDGKAEAIARSTFYNYFYFCVNIGSLIASTVIVSLQENEGYGWGYAVPAFAFAIAMGLIALGYRWYRRLSPQGSPLTRVAKTVTAAFMKMRTPVPADTSKLYEEPALAANIHPLEHTPFLTWLDHAAIKEPADKPAWRWNWLHYVSVTNCEEVKCLINFLPVLATNLAFQMVYNCMFTLFVLQGETLDPDLGSGFNISSSQMTTVDTLAVLVFVPIYDFIIFPLSKKCGRPLTILQRIGIGYVVACLAMVVSALVDMKRIHIINQNNLQDVTDTDNSVPMSIWWQVPQYSLVGISEVFSNVGCYELFYNNAPDSMKSTATALWLVIMGISSYVTSALIQIVTAITNTNGNGGWIANNLNQAHLDYFFWLLAVIMFIDIFFYIFVAYMFRPLKHRKSLEEMEIDAKDSVPPPPPPLNMGASANFGVPVIPALTGSVSRAFSVTISNRINSALRQVASKGSMTLGKGSLSRARREGYEMYENLVQGENPSEIEEVEMQEKGKKQT